MLMTITIRRKVGFAQREVLDVLRGVEVAADASTAEIKAAAARRLRALNTVSGAINAPLRSYLTDIEVVSAER